MQLEAVLIYIYMSCLKLKILRLNGTSVAEICAVRENLRVGGKGVLKGASPQSGGETCTGRILESMTK